jgi:hypothetical protein
MPSQTSVNVTPTEQSVSALTRTLRMVAVVVLGYAVFPAYADDGLVSLPKRDRLAVEPYAGTAVGVGGTFVKEFSEILAQTGTVAGSTFSTALGFDVPNRDFSDVYDAPQEVGVQLNYGLSDLSEVFGGVSYMRASGKAFDALLFTFTGNIGGVPIATGSTMIGEFEDYQEFAANFGYRHFLDTGSGWKPFLGATTSVRKVSAIDLDLRHSSNGVTIDNVRFYRPSIAFAAGLQAGFRYQVSDWAAFGLTTGITYRTNLEQDDSDVVGFREFTNANNRGDILDIPIAIRLTAQF